MAGVAPLPEHRVRCLPPLHLVGGDERLLFEIDGKAKAVSLKLGKFNRRLVAALPDKALDLIEIAALVYAVDASVSRGGPIDPQMGAKWHRRFVVEVPVLDLGLWTTADIKHALEETLMFLSGDRFEFEFVQRIGGRAEQTGYFDFRPDDAWSPDSVVMFSGGLDSFAGALEEIIERNYKVALISHFSSNTIAPIQSNLHKAISKKLGPEKSMHFPMRVQLRKGTNTEDSHRTRSFLFAALGAVTALSFGRDRVSFYENGVVSLNLPPVGNVVGTRATRTTHPQTLARFTDLFGRILGSRMRFDNPSFWRTKTEVVAMIARLGMADQIAHTRSCADVRNQTKQFVHCGRCSQCIDRRFAVLAAGLGSHDPDEAYRLDLLTGVRGRVQDKEAALSYVRLALGHEVMTPVELEQRFPAVFASVKYLGEPAETALQRLTDLLIRHGTSVSGVMRKAIDGRRPDQFPENSLPYLFGDMQRAQAFGLETAKPPEANTAPEPERFTLVFDRNRKSILINDLIEVKGADFELLVHLASEHLRGAGLGLEPLDYPVIGADKLRRLLQLDTEEAVRRRVLRARSSLARKFASANLDPQSGRALIENLPWNGYRLAPDLVVVRMTGS